jgi:S-adenosylmethionine synthetase
MFEKVNPCHPDKVADRIAGAIVDLAYTKEENPKIAVEVLIGYGVCHVISESSCKFKKSEIKSIVHRIAGKLKIDFVSVP